LLESHFNVCEFQLFGLICELIEPYMIFMFASFQLNHPTCYLP